MLAINEMNLQKKITDILGNVWTNLEQGVSFKEHAFHLLNLNTVFDNRPFSRTLVLRSVVSKSNKIIFHSDTRSPKIKHLSQNSRVSCIAYDRQNKVQLKLYGRAELSHLNDYASEHWEASSSYSKLCYDNSLAPGSIVGSYDELMNSQSKKINFDSENAFKNFAVITIHLDAIEWLCLKRDGNESARFEFIDSQWQGFWIAP